MTRQEHLDWCKQDALKYCERGEYREAITAMACDLAKHPETKDHPGIELGIMLLMIGSLDGYQEVKRFIEGFN